MRKILALLVIIGIVTGGYFIAEKLRNNDQEGILRQEQRILRNPIPKEVETFQLGSEIPELRFTKSGTATSETIVYITPQISGRITEINVNVGDQVNAGETLITLGDSLSTDLSNIQYQTAQQSLNITHSTEQFTQENSLNSLATAQVSTQSAKKAFQNALQVKRNAQSAFELQMQGAQLAVQAAEQAYKNAKNSLEDAEDMLDDLDDNYDDLRDEDPENPGLAQLRSAINQAEAQVNSLEFAKISAGTGIEQAELAVNQLEENFAAQTDQLNFAAQTTFLQYRTVLNQMQSAGTGAHLQELGVEAQIAQAQSALQAAGLTVGEQNITSPINGTVTEIQAQQGNLTTPGQILAKVENSETLSIKTSVNEREAGLIAVGDTIILEEGIQGEIISISPTLNEISKKIDVEIEVTDATDIIPGELIQITFSPQPTGRIFIPLNSIRLTETQKLVRIVDEQNIVQLREIQTGQIIGSYIEVVSGLFGTEKIITSVAFFLEEGERVALAN